MKLTKQQVNDFRSKVYNFYNKNRRSFEWRENISPYRIVVSEVMLQQTQTSRVTYKFNQWMKAFPDFKILASATTQQVLSCWQGLGYNRRGLALHMLAKRVVGEFNGMLPNDPNLLESFKGIGPNTAGSICAFAFNKPVIFIETNIRTVFLYEFFKDQKDVHDKQLLPLIEQTLSVSDSRNWYYALMDYGVYLKKVLKVSNKASRHYATQSKFEGSKRQVRGVVVKILSKVGSLSFQELSELVAIELPSNQHCLETVLSDLQKDGLVNMSKLDISITK